ncbi:elongin BC and Polycomb repressive complex 2-associated protein-like [Lagopus muta]|uniref:elongin BC and Polycomb repressive complex 2-associated protein-like n=1 Tax=Lagopus muta TaxID=64668 RepID=UPI0020A182C8|nr:elongin BC and Polycomb repressive complex 2-associated protein-like [Lagopus muta]
MWETTTVPLAAGGSSAPCAASTISSLPAAPRPLPRQDGGRRPARSPPRPRSSQPQAPLPRRGTERPPEGGGSAREQGGGRGSSSWTRQRAGRGRPSVVRDSPKRGPVPPPVFAASLGGAVAPPVWGKGEASRGNRSCLGGESQCEGQGGAGRCRSARQQPDCAAPSCSAPGAPAKAALPALPPSTQPSARSCQAGGGGGGSSRLPAAMIGCLRSQL